MGAFAVVFCLVWSLQFGGVAAMLAQVSAGVPLAIGWAVCAGGGVMLLLHGISEALSHDDEFDGGSFLYSVGAIGLAAFGLAHHWYLPDGSAVQFSRALWFAWMASNAFNIALELRGSFRRRAAAAGDALMRAIPDSSRRLRRRRVVTIEEEIEGHGIDLAQLHGPAAGTKRRASSRPCFSRRDRG